MRVSGAKWGRVILVVPRGEGAEREGTPTSLRGFPALSLPPLPMNRCACISLSAREQRRIPGEGAIV